MAQLHHVAIFCGLMLASLAAGHSSCPFLASNRISKDAPVSAAMMGQIPYARNKSDPLVAANSLFHSLYSTAGEAMRPSWTIMVESDYLVLLNATADRVRVEPYTPQIYHSLKMVVHMPLSVVVTTLPDITVHKPPMRRSLAQPLPVHHDDDDDGADSTPRPLSASTLASLAHMQAAMVSAQASLTQETFPAPGQLARQQAIFSSTLALLRQLLADKQWSLSAAQSFAEGLAPAMDPGIDEAAAAQLGLLDQVVQDWKANVLSPAQWEDMRVVVTTSHMARPGSSIAQYFSRLFEEDIQTARRFIVLEGVSDESSALKALDVYQTDDPTGKVFFSDLFRMREDLLCAAGKKALDGIFPQSANTTTADCLPWY